MKSALAFTLALLAGLAAGLAYGWLVNPASCGNTSPDSLRQDYQTDTILMVAEVFQANRDLDLAASWLAALGKGRPAEVVQRAAGDARRTGYAPDDVERLADLAAALQSREPAAGRAAP